MKDDLVFSFFSPFFLRSFSKYHLYILDSVVQILRNRVLTTGISWMEHSISIRKHVLCKKQLDDHADAEAKSFVLVNLEGDLLLMRVIFWF